MRPDFFIAGAAKCGTTALFEYLSRHPAVFMPRIKEPKFFCPDLKTTGGVYAERDYRALFADVPDGFLTGEASALYLYSEVAIPRIMAFNPSARIIVMLRHPVDAAHSLHASRWGFGHEDIPSFEAAWQAQATRLAGKRMPRGWPDPATLQYGAMYRYSPQVRRVLEFVPAGQRLFMVHEEFFGQPATQFAKVLRFLGLAPAGDREFPVINPTLGARSTRVDRWLRGATPWLGALSAPLQPLARATGFHPLRALRSWNAVPSPKPVLNPKFRAELDRYFAADIRELEGLLGRRLWSDRSSSSASGRTLETYLSQ